MSKLKVLVVDDEKEICELTRSFLARRNFAVFTASSSQEALSLVEAEHPQVALLDMKLGDESGIDILSKIKAADKNIKVVMVTALEDEGSMKQAIALGADDYVLKPFKADYLCELINKVMR
jgi:DNA-binding response OmpR family regulator